MIKVSDFIAKRLREKYKVKHVFMISGGGAMHLNDSFGKEIDYICNHHEQASAIAAEGYARYNQQLAVVNVTTGPGGLNALNGVLGQWTDSVPVLYISGQVKFETTIGSCPEIGLRQLGDQEADIISIVKPLVKYAQTVNTPKDIGKILDRAVFEATHGRKGPVWIDVPMNVQGAIIDESELETDDESYVHSYIYDNPYEKAEFILRKIEESSRPLIIAGHGIRLSGAMQEFYELLQLLNIPVVTTLNGFDTITDDHPQFIGRIGTIGQRAGNFALQNADLILCLGTRNNIRQVSYNWENFAHRAYKIVIDIDKAELNKPTIKPDLPIHADLKKVLEAITDKKQKIAKKEWLNWCHERKINYHPSKNEDYKQTKTVINPYEFIRIITSLMKEDELIVTGNASPCVCMLQAGIVKKAQRVIWNSGNASMGYDLPAAIGACFSAGKKRTVCLAGDGSIMMNLQELQTIAHYRLPIKIFVINNGGYSSIIQTQTNFFNGRLTACACECGVTTPDFAKVAHSFGITAYRIENPAAMEKQIKEALDADGPVLCDIITDSEQIFIPKLSSEKLPDGKMVSKPLEDMFPFLPRDEFNSNMIV